MTYYNLIEPYAGIPLFMQRDLAKRITQDLMSQQARPKRLELNRDHRPRVRGDLLRERRPDTLLIYPTLEWGVGSRPRPRWGEPAVAEDQEVVDVDLHPQEGSGLE